ncbi:MAG: hypothetical protein HOE86_18210 [Gemmatimonadetes bacterium]|nr:hypothetical protein [Gemmatimonadota bacterium]
MKDVTYGDNPTDGGEVLSPGATSFDAVCFELPACIGCPREHGPLLDRIDGDFVQGHGLSLEPRRRLLLRDGDEATGTGH